MRDYLEGSCSGDADGDYEIRLSDATTGQFERGAIRIPATPDQPYMSRPTLPSATIGRRAVAYVRDPAASISESSSFPAAVPKITPVDN